MRQNASACKMMLLQSSPLSPKIAKSGPNAGAGDSAMGVDGGMGLEREWERDMGGRS